MILLLLALSCPETKIIDKTNLKWTDWDTYEISYAKKRCRELYPNEAECLIKFFKLGFQNYYASCGESK